MKQSCRFILAACLLAGVIAHSARAQQTTPQAGLRENPSRVHALENARVYVRPDLVIEGGTVVVRDGLIVETGVSVEVPSDARRWDYSGMTIYPGLIEMFTQAGLPGKAEDNIAGSSYWNPAVRPERAAAEAYRINEAEIVRLRKSGFAAAMVVADRGVFAGSSAVVKLGAGTPNENVLKRDVFQHIRMKRNRNRTYPAAMMGVAALMRQTILDAQWFRDAHAAYASNPRQDRPEENDALAALDDVVARNQAVLMSVDDDHAFLRAARLAEEFGLRFLVRGSGHEYRMLDAVRAAGVPVILPIDFPRSEALSVSTPEDASNVTLETLRHWDLAPGNPGRLHRAGIPIALSSTRLARSTDFHDRVREAIAHGLDYEAALAALTTTPASMLGISRQLGTLEPGKLASMTITDGPLFGENVNVQDVWVAGDRYVVTPRPAVDPRGGWMVILKGDSLSLSINGSLNSPKGSVDIDGAAVKADRMELDDARIAFSLEDQALGEVGVWRLSGSIRGDRIAGRGVRPDGESVTWTAERTRAREAEPAEIPESVSMGDDPPELYPPGAFGRESAPERPEHILVRNATVWTLDDQGKLENADLLIQAGKIVEVGTGLAAPGGALEIDGTGKHVTPGIIDAHSHTAILEGINEGTQAVTAEVGIGDVIDSYDIAMYRELAGGLTVANVLHGSANPIGGKNQIIKLRWGAGPEELKFTEAKAGIKFALGENVKRSNWRVLSDRYPQTRMGVEQIIRDRFLAAREYQGAWDRYNALADKSGVVPPRRDLELETLQEVLAGERLVHCHSYRQDEILMLIRVADEFGFTIGTFQHVLEGYKVAPEIAAHGAGASAFSDWWAFKIEAYDAIPHNGALMHEAGVLVTFNSDSDELARRLNTEAAKAVKYGGVDEVEALKFVTLNAAIQLAIDPYVGSLEPGKDADFVIWNGHPLSTYTKCEQTWIDGRKYFDIDEDREMRTEVEKERTRLIQKLLKAPETDEEEAPEA
ncbi:MAG: amidohydrolase family protein [Gemmatimonadetes bacterium]|nr:amidohydrolase family protein [Gemmatimonadota bacterium]